ncbi:MAG: hypothetical protein PHZ04_00180 [Patescibacteria group bacterium]|nr:hypothetical protein [Patescibacteria group bacterium]
MCRPDDEERGIGPGKEVPQDEMPVIDPEEENPEEEDDPGGHG